jgi:hypothetical protein
MKTNNIIALVPAQWKAPWRMPVGSSQMETLLPLGKRIGSGFTDKLKKTARDFKDIIKKHWLHD